MAQELDAGNKERAEILAELYVRAGADYADKAIAVHMKMLRDEPFKYDSYKALDSIYRDAHQYDKRWCMCATLAFLKKADQEQLQFYEQYKPRGLVKAKSLMTSESWGKLIHADDALERSRSHLLAFRDGHMWWQDGYTTAFYDRSQL